MRCSSFLPIAYLVSSDLNRFSALFSARGSPHYNSILVCNFHQSTPRSCWFWSCCLDHGHPRSASWVARVKLCAELACLVSWCYQVTRSPSGLRFRKLSLVWRIYLLCASASSRPADGNDKCGVCYPQLYALLFYLDKSALWLGAMLQSVDRCSVAVPRPLPWFSIRSGYLPLNLSVCFHRSLYPHLHHLVALVA